MRGQSLILTTQASVSMSRLERLGLHANSLQLRMDIDHTTICGAMFARKSHCSTPDVKGRKCSRGRAGVKQSPVRIDLSSRRSTRDSSLAMQHKAQHPAGKPAGCDSVLADDVIPDFQDHELPWQLRNCRRNRTCR
jgi:hypothetical protein